MLPIASDLAVRRTREQAESALPDAPVRPDPPGRARRSGPAASRRFLAAGLRRLAAATVGLADRVDRPVGAR